MARKRRSPKGSFPSPDDEPPVQSFTEALQSFVTTRGSSATKNESREENDTEGAADDKPKEPDLPPAPDQGFAAIQSNKKYFCLPLELEEDEDNWNLPIEALKAHHRRQKRLSMPMSCLCKHLRPFQRKKASTSSYNQDSLQLEDFSFPGIQWDDSKSYPSQELCPPQSMSSLQSEDSFKFLPTQQLRKSPAPMDLEAVDSEDSTPTLSTTPEPDSPNVLVCPEDRVEA